MKFAWINIISGMIVLNEGESVLTGFTLANGREVRRDEYPELFGNIGTKYGKGDGKYTFNLPRLIQE